MEQHFVGKVNTKLIIEGPKGILITHDVKEKQDRWGFVGGRLNADESVEEALMREAQEELGLRVVVGPLIFTEQIGHTSDTDFSYLYLTFTGRLEDPFAIPQMPTEELAQVIWVDKNIAQKYKFYPSCVNPLARYWEMRL